MPLIELGLGDWESFTQNLSRQKLRNMYLVENPISSDGVSRVSRPTLKTVANVGTGPIYNVWSQPNVLNGDSLVVSGSELYRLNLTTLVPTLLGSLPGTDLAEFAADTDRVLVLRDGNLFIVDSVGAITAVPTPDLDPAGSVTSLNNYFIISIRGTQKFYWIQPGASVIDDLDFASAERIPDPIVSVQSISDELWLIGQSGPEVWQPSGDADAPFIRVAGRVYKEGCHNTKCVVSTSIDGQPALLWVTDTKAVVKSQGAPMKISNESIEELLKTEDDITAWFFRYNRHDFYLINSASFTLVYDITSSLWAKWDTYLLPYWVAQTGTQKGSSLYSGDRYSNKIYLLEEGVADDDLNVVREVSGFIRNFNKPIPCNEVVAYVNGGYSPTYVDEPILELRWSEDLGATWGNYISASLGERGDFNKTVAFRSLGHMRDPGRIFEFRMTDKTRFRLDYATYNERVN